jgi:2'-5' RNA ligase
MRLFIATTFPAEVLGALNETVLRVRTKLPHAAWVRPESQHLTFAFLGEQEESAVSRIQVDAGAKFDASLHGCGFFPNRRNARVGWIGVEPPERFAALAGRVRDGVKAANVTMDEKEFRPHLTLMRIRDRWPPLAAEMFENAFRDYRSATFPVAAVTLYSSRLSPTGAIHTPLRTFALA